MVQVEVGRSRDVVALPIEAGGAQGKVVRKKEGRIRGLPEEVLDGLRAERDGASLAAYADAPARLGSAIEALVVEVNEDRTRDLGLHYGYGQDNGYGRPEM